ncbi:Protein of unknown function DUF674 [Dillenia turbinata]|uniref:Uncharacterized protein n=1 Tax=Dillenia turbinata TaxID=194707 RepID=A0AAN8VDU7_9MAGN
MAPTQLELKLLIHPKSRKVLFAEAGKDFVDFLCIPLVLPVGKVIQLLSKSMIGSFGALYESIENLSETYFQPNLDKGILLKPFALLSVSEAPLLLTDVESSSHKFYTCPYSCRFIADNNQAICPNCNGKMSSDVSYVPPPALAVSSSSSSSSGGYVKGAVTYMVMDDLTVKPMSSTSFFTVLKKFNVKDIGALEEKIVQLGMAEGLNLLREAFQSKDVLTNVFLDKNSAVFGTAEGGLSSDEYSE